MQLGLCVLDCQIKSLQREPMTEIEHREILFSSSIAVRSVRRACIRVMLPDALSCFILV